MKTSPQTKNPATVLASQATDRDGVSNAAAQATVNSPCRTPRFFASVAAGMRTTAKLIAVVLVAMAFTTDVNAASPSSSFVGVCATRNSPNRFPTGQCTWFSDIACAEFGRPLAFSRSWGRDAVTWPALVTSARGCLARPAANSLVVFGALNTPGGAGHVAWVESVGRDGSFSVLHVNYSGPPVGYLNNVPIVRTTFQFVPGGLVQAVGGKTKLQVTSFILP